MATGADGVPSRFNRRPTTRGVPSRRRVLTSAITLVLAVFALSVSAGAQTHPDDVYWDAAFGAAGANSRVEVLYVDGDDLYVGGHFTTIGGIAASGIARWDGETWHAFGAGIETGEGRGVSEIWVHDGVVYAGGYFPQSGGVVYNNIARWDGAHWLPMGGGLTDYSCIPPVNCIVAFQDDIYVGGSMRKAGGESVYGVARWDGNQWHNPGGGPCPQADYPFVGGMDTDGDYLYAAGWLQIGGDNSNVAKWDGYEWSVIPSVVRGDCRDLVVVGSDLYVAGWFNMPGAGGETVNNIGRWDGTQWHGLDGGTNDMVLSIFPVGDDVYIAGNFTRAGGKPASRVAVWDGTDWRPLGGGIDLRGWTFAVAARENGEAFVGGDHDTAGGISSPRIARWFNPVPYPANPIPPDGAKNRRNDIDLEWGSSGAAGLPDTWDVYLGVTPDPPMVASGLISASFVPDTLYNDTQYYWKVVARNGSGDHATGQVWTFRTEDLVTSKLVVTSASGRCRTTPDTVTIDVNIEDSPVPIDAAGVDIQYDPSVLSYLYCEPGDLTAGWQHFECADLGTTVRVGGFDTTAIPPSSYGGFATLYFLGDCSGLDSTVSYDLTPVNLTDDLAGLREVPGVYTCEYFVPDGDINDDGYITSADAYCTFESYLSFPVPLPNDCGANGWDIRSDVDCSGDITPRDALCIYNNWVDGSCEFCGESGPEASALQTPASVSIREVRYSKTAADVVIAVSNAPALGAFGFEIEYTRGPLEFVGVMRSQPTMAFEQFGATTPDTDRVRIGGFSTQSVDATGLTDLAVVRFELQDVLEEGSVEISRCVDDLAGAAPVHRVITGAGNSYPRYDRFVLHQNYPNPFNPDTDIRYEVPEYAGRTRVEISIFDVRGALVKTLENRERSTGSYTVRWNGRNEAGESVSSGVYFYVLRTGRVVLSRKLVLLK